MSDAVLSLEHEIKLLEKHIQELVKKRDDYIEIVAVFKQNKSIKSIQSFNYMLFLEFLKKRNLSLYNAIHKASVKKFENRIIEFEGGSREIAAIKMFKEVLENMMFEYTGVHIQID